MGQIININRTKNRNITQKILDRKRPSLAELELKTSETSKENLAKVIGLEEKMTQKAKNELVSLILTTTRNFGVDKKSPKNSQPSTGLTEKERKRVTNLILLNTKSF